MNRALSGALVDLVRDGVSPIDLRAGGDRAVFKALVRTAASASQRGQTEQEWSAFVSETASRLGAQARMKQGRRERKIADYYRTLHNAWTAAEKWLATRPPPASPEDITRIADIVSEFAADPDMPLPDAWRAVLAYAATFARQKGTTRPALPRRTVVENTGLTDRGARTALAQLSDSGLLPLAVRGRSGADPKRQKANLYRLPDAGTIASYLCRETRPMGHPHQTYGTPATWSVGTPAQTYGTHPPQVTDEEGESVLTIKGRPEDIAAFIAALPLSAREQLAAVAPPTPRAGNVVPLRPVADKRSA